MSSVVTATLKEAVSSFFLYPIAWRHKLAGIKEGFITKESLWDRLVFDGARAKVIGDCAGTLRQVVVSGGTSTFLVPADFQRNNGFFLLGIIDAADLTPARIALSVPLVNSFIHPVVAGPVLASYPYDLQEFPTLGTTASAAHVGPPSVNVEAKLIGVDDDAVEGGASPAGVLNVRGPPVGKVIGVDDYVSIPELSEETEGWVSTGARVLVRTNGSFVVLDTEK